MRRNNPSILALTLLLSAGALIAQTPPEATSAEEQTAPRPDQVFVDTLEVEVVNIDVYVRDSDGNPVPGLTADDFELFVDGRPAAISNFYTVSERSEERQPPPTRQPESEPAKEASATPRPEPPPPPKDQSLLVVVYIDNYNLTPFKRNRVLKELRQFLREELTPQDRVMLATYDRSLNLRHPFTARADNIARAMLELEDISAQRIHHVRERSDLLDRIEDADSPTEAMIIAETFAGSVRNDLEFTLDALRSVVDNLAASSGRKALVYVSEGLPMIPAQDLFQAVQLKWQERVSLLEMYHFDMSKRFHELANQANANRVSFYTVDARGLTVYTQGTVDPQIKGQAGEGALIDQFNNSNLQSTIQLIAERTGGRAIINTNRFLPDLRKIGTDFRNYYSLGYASGSIGDGRYHRFEVKLKNRRRGVTVRHRDGYRSKSVETRMHDGTLSALNLDLQDNPLGAEIDFGTPRIAERGLYAVPFRLRIPYSALALIPREQLHLGKMRIWFVAKDHQDEMSDVQQVPVNLEIPANEAERPGARWEMSFDLTMEPGFHSVAVGIRDDLGQQNSFLRRSIQIGDRNAGR